MTLSRAGAALATLLAGVAAGCGKSESPPKPNPITERQEALERAKKDAFGAQVKGLGTAQDVGADLNRKAEAGLDAADRMSK